MFGNIHGTAITKQAWLGNFVNGSHEHVGYSAEAISDAVELARFSLDTTTLAWRSTALAQLGGALDFAFACALANGA